MEMCDWSHTYCSRERYCGWSGSPCLALLSAFLQLDEGTCICHWRRNDTSLLHPAPCHMLHLPGLVNASIQASLRHAAVSKKVMPVKPGCTHSQHWWHIYALFQLPRKAPPTLSMLLQSSQCNALIPLSLSLASSFPDEWRLVIFMHICTWRWGPS
jgi:hypothetical protein